MTWRLNGKEPVFVQISDRLRAEILCGNYAPGDQFPTVRQLASEVAVNPNTVQRALTLLEEEGLLQTNGTQGRFVTQDADVLTSAKAALQRKTVQELFGRAKALGITGADIIRMIKKKEVEI